jgi:glyceraldehyde-3-phosphate dehydrogenase type II
MKNVLIVGTGTIGEPLIGLLSDFRKKLGINVYFNKRTPLVDEVAKVESLIKRGAKLVTSPVRKSKFEAMGHKVDCVYEEALEKADVVIDCTPAGNENKDLYYQKASELRDKKNIFIAQGSEKGFGLPYAYGINDKALNKRTPNFIQVVSCNTHNISSLIKTICPTITDLYYGDFTCIRRANDISQNGSFIASPEVGSHKYSSFGTHHAKDAYDLFSTVYETPNLFSSALKVNTQYMHTIRFNIHIRKYVTEKDIIDKFKENKFIALTHKNLANKVFSFGRDHGYYGRIFNHTVINLPSIHIGRNNGQSVVTGFCFTPQDGNSLLSSIAATMYGLYGEEYMDYMKKFDNYLFQEI